MNDLRAITNSRQSVSLRWKRSVRIRWLIRSQLLGRARRLVGRVACKRLLHGIAPLARCLAAVRVARDEEEVRLVALVELELQRGDIELQPGLDELRDGRLRRAVELGRCHYGNAQLSVQDSFAMEGVAHTLVALDGRVDHIVLALLLERQVPPQLANDAHAVCECSGARSALLNARFRDVSLTGRSHGVQVDDHAIADDGRLHRRRRLVVRVHDGDARLLDILPI